MATFSLVPMVHTQPSVRQATYKDMAEKEILPASDMVGTTHPLDPEKFPVVKDTHCHFTTIIGYAKAHTANSKRHITLQLSCPSSPLRTFFKVQLDEKAVNEARFRNAEWTPESNEKMINEIRDFPIKHYRDDDSEELKKERRTLGDLIDATDPALISKVFLEVKLFESWHHGRTVLIGDAVHKMQPSAGQGAVNAMEDAVILANCLYDLSDGKEP
ncbi:hypothetical protein BGZ65_010252, partial [Modicella reniformis]